MPITDPDLQLIGDILVRETERIRRCRDDGTLERDVCDRLIERIDRILAELVLGHIAANDDAAEVDLTPAELAELDDAIAKADRDQKSIPHERVMTDLDRIVAGGA